MTAHSCSRVLTILAVAFALALGTLAGAAAAGQAATPADDHAWQLRFGGVGVDSDPTFRTVDGSGARSSGRSENFGGGLGVSAEYRFSERFGTEIGLIAAADVSIRLDYPYTTNTFGFDAITGGLNVHLTPDRAVDVYLGPLVAYVHYEDLGYTFLTAEPAARAAWWPDWVPGSRVSLTLDDELAFGVNVGFDVRFGGSRWSFSGALKYLATNADGTTSLGDPTEVDLDPLIVSLGAGYRF